MRNRIVALLLIAIASTSRAEDLGAYLAKHASAVAGLVVVDDQKEKLVELRIVDDFAIAPQYRGFARLSLFSIMRAGELAPPTIPTTVEQAKAYSDGEVWLGAYRIINPTLAIEVLGGVTWKMTSITGQVGDPLDGTKLALAAGPRITLMGNEVSILLGHFGPVVEADKLAGPVPSVLIHAYIPLGAKAAFVPDFAFGRLPDRTFVRTLRLGIATRF